MRKFLFSTISNRLLGIIFIGLSWSSIGEGLCPATTIKSACKGNCENATECVESMAFLVGGRNIIGWRKDAEILMLDNNGNVQLHPKQIADFPYVIDVPYGYWGGGNRGLIICGGKNWESDAFESRCWTYDPCSNTWNSEVPDMPTGSSGGIGVTVEERLGEPESFWILGGGNGSAINNVQILKGIENEQGYIDWTWSEGNPLFQARYGQCAVYHKKEGLIYVAGGRDDEGILRSIETVEPLGKGNVQLLTGESTPRPRWGSLCQYINNPQLDTLEQIIFMGGMDEIFLPHHDVDMYHPMFGYKELQPLPQNLAGGIGVPLGSRFLHAGGYSLTGFRKEIYTMDQFGDEGFTLEDLRLSSSRVSGLAVAVPVDLFDYC